MTLQKCLSLNMRHLFVKTTFTRTCKFYDIDPSPVGETRIPRNACGSSKSKAWQTYRQTTNKVIPMWCSSLLAPEIIPSMISYLRKRCNEVVNIGAASCSHDLLHGYFSEVVTVSDILCDTAVKQDGFLGYDADLLSEPLNIVACQVFVVQ